MKRGTLILSLLLILFLSGCISLSPKVRECNVDKAVEFLMANPDEDIDSIKKTLSSRKYNCKALAENSVELLPKEIRERAKEMREIDIEHATECAVVGNFEELHCHDDDRCGECLDDPATDAVEGFNLVDPGEDIIDVRDVVLVANTIDDPCYLDSGDLNGDDLINVLDIVILINFVMGLGGDDLTSAQECAADLNQDGIYNVLDVVSMINIILYGGDRDRENAMISVNWITTSSEWCSQECTQHSDCEGDGVGWGEFCHSGWDGERYGPRFCAAYHNDYCENNPCGDGDGDCDSNDDWGDGTLGSNGCGPDMTCEDNNCGIPNLSGPDCCVGDEPNYDWCNIVYDTCGEIPVQINLDQSGSQNIQGVQIDICPDPFYPTEDNYEILSEGLTAFNSWMWRVEFDGEPTDAAPPCSCASITGQCTRFIGLAITLDQDKLIQSGTTNLPIVQVNIQNPNFPLNTDYSYQNLGISGMLTTNVGQQITTTFNGLSETLCGDLGFTCSEEGTSTWNIPDDFVDWFGVTECSIYNEGDTVDCSGVINGNSVEDICGVCNGNGCHQQNCTEYPPGNIDCEGTCLLEIDCVGICGGMNNCQWSNTFGTINLDHAYSVQQTADGGYILGGDSYIISSNSPWLIKFDSEGNTEWNQTEPYLYFNESLYLHHIRSVQQTADGGYIAVGGGSGYYPGILKTDSNGIQEWFRIWIVSDPEYHADTGNSITVSTIQQTIDGGYIVSGWVRYGGSHYDGFLLKLDPDGNEEWYNHYDNSGSSYDTDEYIYSATEVLLNCCNTHGDCNTGYFCHSGWDGEGYGPRSCQVYDSSYCENNPCGVGDGDCDYNDNWGDGTLGSEGCGPDMTCGNNHNLDNCGADFPEYENGPDCCVGDEPNYVTCEEGDSVSGGYIIVGKRRFQAPSQRASWVVKTDNEGNAEWNRYYELLSEYGWTTEARGVVQTTEGGYAIAGTVVGESGTDDAYLLKLDATGNEEWINYFSGEGLDYAYSLKQTTDEGYILAGWTNSYGLGDYDAWLIKTNGNTDGTVEWTKIFGGSNTDYAYSVQQTTDGGYVFAGYTNSVGQGDYDAWILKTDSSGN